MKTGKRYIIKKKVTVQYILQKNKKKILKMKQKCN